MRLRTALILGLGAVPLLLAAPSCSSNGAGPSDAATGDEPDGLGEDAEPILCTEFTEAGAPCPVPSPVRCFAECEAGGCYCREQGPGRPPVWECTVDLSCLPDCGPLDDGCSPVISFGDAGSGDDGPEEGAASDAEGDGETGDAGGADAMDAGSAGDAMDGGDGSG
jgi:hypothetical protein